MNWIEEDFEVISETDNSIQSDEVKHEIESHKHEPHSHSVVEVAKSHIFIWELSEYENLHNNLL